MTWLVVTLAKLKQSLRERKNIMTSAELRAEASEDAVQRGEGPHPGCTLSARRGTTPRRSVHMHSTTTCSAKELESMMDKDLVDLECDLGRDPCSVASSWQLPDF